MVDGDVCILPCVNHPYCSSRRGKWSMPDEEESWLYIHLPNGRKLQLADCYFRFGSRPLGDLADLVREFTGYDYIGGNHTDDDLWSLGRELNLHGWRLHDYWSVPEVFRQQRLKPFLQSGPSSYFFVRDIARAISGIARKNGLRRCPECRLSFFVQFIGNGYTKIYERFREHKICEYRMEWRKRLTVLTPRLEALLDEASILKTSSDFLPALYAYNWAKRRASRKRKQTTEKMELDRLVREARANLDNVGRLAKRLARIEREFHREIFRRHEQERKEELRWRQNKQLLTRVRKALKSSDPIQEIKTLRVSR